MIDVSRLAHSFLVLASTLLFAATASAELPKGALDDVRTMVETAPGEIGLAVAVTDRDRTVLVATHGFADIAQRRPVTKDTLFAIGSISKSFTALAMLQLADEGRFDPDAPIARYLPDFHPRSRFPAMTGQALMAHTAGLPNYLTNVASMRYLIAALNEFEPTYAPGSHFWYSNSGYQLLGYAAERIEGRPFPLILKQRVLDRLGMTSTEPQMDESLRGRIASSYIRGHDGTYAESPWFDYLASDGAIVSTAPDMSAYGRMMLARGAVPDGRLVSPAAFDRFAKPVIDDYGLGIQFRQNGQVLAHGGAIAGFRAHLEAHLAEGFAVTFLSNGPLDQSLVKRIVARLTSDKSDDAEANAAKAPPPLPDDASFAGNYLGAQEAALRFAVDPNGGLNLVEGGKRMKLTRLGRDSWGLYLSEQGPRAFTFFRDEAGAITDVVEGASDFAREGSGHKLVAAPEAYRRLVGRYQMHGEEGPNVRVLARNGQLMIAYVDYPDAAPLVQTGPDRFRLAKPDHAPEWFSFDTIMDGKAQRLLMTGVPVYRIDLP